MKPSISIILGPGGVGKTTSSALLAHSRLNQGQRVLALTLDPSGRLLDILKPQPKLEVEEVQALKIFEDILSKKPNSVDASKIKSNKLFQQLLIKLKGVQEFTSLYRLQQAYHSGNYDSIILDTPPTQNIMDFFLAPEELQTLFESQIMGLFIGMKKKNLLNRLLMKTKEYSFKILKSLTGAAFFDELLDFMNALSGMREEIEDSLSESQKLLKLAEFYYVSKAEEDSAEKAQNKASLFKLKLGYDISFYIFNRTPLRPPKIFHNQAELREAFESSLADFINWKKYIDNQDRKTLNQWIQIPELNLNSYSEEQLNKYCLHFNA